MKKYAVLIVLGVVNVVIGYALFADNGFSRVVLLLVGYRDVPITTSMLLVDIGLAGVAAVAFLVIKRRWQRPVPVSDVRRGAWRRLVEQKRLSEENR